MIDAPLRLATIVPVGGKQAAMPQEKAFAGCEKVQANNLQDRAKKIDTIILSVKKLFAMPTYYVNKQEGEHGEHEVHKDGCKWMPSPWNRRELGWFHDCKNAVVLARKSFPSADGCKHCSPECHTV